MDLPALLFLAAVLAIKEAGLPIPVPGDLLVIGAGVAATRGGLPVVAIVVVLVAATVVGGVVQFVLVRGRARTSSSGSSPGSACTRRPSSGVPRDSELAAQRRSPSPG